jgi:GGDEF domain-containing protein
MENSQLSQELASYNLKLRENEEQIEILKEELQFLRHEVIHDPETNLYSPAYFHARLNEEIVRSERYRHFFSLVLAHLDLHANLSSQQVTRDLKSIGREMVLGLTRRTDIVALYRRHQMVIMLPETDLRGANLLIQRYQAAFPDNGRRLRYSVLTYPNDASNIELVLGRLQDLSEDLFRSSGFGTDTLVVY